MKVGLFKLVTFQIPVNASYCEIVIYNNKLYLVIFRFQAQNT